jgi:hypothetical protein
MCEQTNTHVPRAGSTGLAALLCLGLLHVLAPAGSAAQRLARPYALSYNLRLSGNGASQRSAGACGTSERPGHRVASEYVRSDCNVRIVSVYSNIGAQGNRSDPEQWFGVQNSNGTVKPSGARLRPHPAPACGARGRPDVQGNHLPPAGRGARPRTQAPNRPALDRQLAPAGTDPSKLAQEDLPPAREHQDTAPGLPPLPPQELQAAGQAASREARVTSSPEASRESRRALRLRRR